jgi:Gas vesicle synthesis protein GvpL/GvpF
MSDPEAIWVYAVVQRNTLPDDGSDAVEQLVGVAGGSVRLVSTADLTAVVSPVELAEFGEEPLRRNMEHLPWLEAVARMHHDVVSAIASVTAVVPMRLATVYRTDLALARMLEQRRDDFRAVLGHIAGRSEWGVKAYVATPGDTPSPSADRNSGAPAAPGSGSAYLMKRSAQLTAAEKSRQAAVASAERVHRELAGQAAAAALHRPQDPQLSGTTARMIMNATYLVDDGDRAGFAAAVERAASANPALRLELTGPWPPYSFAAAQPGTATIGAGAAR